MSTKSGLSKKDLIDKFKISIFERNINNTTVFAAELICSGYGKLLLNTCIELWCKFYILSSEISFLIYELIELLKTVKYNEIYKYEDIRFLLINLAVTLCMSNKQQINLFQAKIQKKDIELSDKLNEIPNFYLKLLNTYESYIDEDNYNNIILLLYNFYKKKSSNFNKILSYLIDKSVKKIDLKLDFEVIHSTLTKNYIWIFLDILKHIYMNIKDINQNRYYNIYVEIFNYDLIKSNIFKRINIIFMLFNMLIRESVNNIYNNHVSKNSIDIETVTDIFSKLIIFYELDTSIKETKEIKNRKTTDDDGEEKYTTKENSKNKKSISFLNEDVEYLYTLTYINPKKISDKEKNSIRIDYFPAQKTINVSDFELHNSIRLEIDKIRI